MAISSDADSATLQGVVRDFLGRRAQQADNRDRLEAAADVPPSHWSDIAKLGWLGLHLPERCGGSGAGLATAGAVLEEFGRAVAPGPLLSCVVASAIIDRCADDVHRDRWLPGLADGSTLGAIGPRAQLNGDHGQVSGDAGAVLGAELADVLVLVCDEDVLIIDAKAPGVDIHPSAGIDPARRSARVLLHDVTVAASMPGAAEDATAVLRTLAAADAVGGASQCVADAVGYAKIREQFGRPIGMFQSVKHLCADMFVDAEAATAAVWDALRAADEPGSQFQLAAAAAARLAIPAYQRCAESNIQVHGGIGFTWEHNAHLYYRRAIALAGLVPFGQAGDDLVRLSIDGVRREARTSLPQAAEDTRAELRARLATIAALADGDRFGALVDSRLTMPHWPAPWGVGAGPAQQIVLEQELHAAGIDPGGYGITSWVITTIVEHGSDEQKQRWIEPALRKDEIWCQLFSEPGAGSDAAAVSTLATRSDGGWLLNGQKVWSSNAAAAAYGLATVRTNREVSKHKGITVMAVRMNAAGVDVRPLRQITGESHFNEVFLNDVFIPDTDVVGAIDDGWAVARATLGNEQIGVSTGAPGADDPDVAALDVLPLFVEAGQPAALRDDVAWIVARHHSCQLMNLRRIERVVAGAAPGAESYVAKAVKADATQEAASMCLRLVDPDQLMSAEPGSRGRRVAENALRMRRKSIAGGSYQIARNVIGERLLGLPRDPLLR